MLVVCDEWSRECLPLRYVRQAPVWERRRGGSYSNTRAQSVRTQTATYLAARAPYTAAVSAASPYFFKKLGSCFARALILLSRATVRLFSPGDEERVPVLSPPFPLVVFIEPVVSSIDNARETSRG